MSTVTKLALQQANTALAQECDRLRHQVAQLQADFQRVTSVASAVNQSCSVTRRAQAMAAAKALALGSGRCIKVIS